jgi:hypothetical protein
MEYIVPKNHSDLLMNKKSNLLSIDDKTPNKTISTLLICMNIWEPTSSFVDENICPIGLSAYE